jgi:outer membrane protein
MSCATAVWWKGCLVLCASVAISLSGGLVAQDVPQQLTLEDAISLAREWNPAYRRTIAQADVSGADVLAATGRFLPTLNASVDFTGTRSTVATGQDDFGGNIELSESRTIERSYSSQGLSSQITLFDGFQNLNGLRSARAGADAAQWGVDAQAAVLDAEVKRQFYAAIRLQQLIAIEERLLDSRIEELDATERLFRVAAREQVDVLGAQVEVARQEQSLESAQGEARKSLLVLAEVIGLGGGAEFQVAGDFPAEFDPADLDSEALVQQILATNPRMRQAEASATQADFAASQARGLRWPTLSAGAGFSRSVGQEGYSGLFDLNPQDRAFRFDLSLSLPIFTRFNTAQSIAQANANREASHENAREMGLQLEREVRAALIDLQNTHRQLQLAERSAELGRQRLDMAQEQYQLGSRSFTELQQIVNVSANDERNALAARLNYVNAVIGLEQVMGRPVVP